jgi:putative IMPACT (imprinted ancient) family translation regulator
LGTVDVRTRSNDDGEPTSTAGKPILSLITANDLTNILIVVVRYFGGTLLGTSGLINAYRSAAADAIKNSTIETHDIEIVYRIECPYSTMNQVFQIVRSEGYHQMQSTMEEKCIMVISVKKSETSRVETLLGSIYGVTYQRQVC